VVLHVRVLVVGWCVSLSSEVVIHKKEPEPTANEASAPRFNELDDELQQVLILLMCRNMLVF
jgi:hypothetical protein